MEEYKKIDTKVTEVKDFSFVVDPKLPYQPRYSEQALIAHTKLNQLTQDALFYDYTKRR